VSYNPVPSCTTPVVGGLLSITTPSDLYILPILILLTEYTLKDTHLGSGLRYYTTVTACNTATLCTSVTSDGVVIDNSPPTTGVVQDGRKNIEVHHITGLPWLQ
jgi:hypothetical protein